MKKHSIFFPSHYGHIRGAAVGLQDEVAVLLGGEVALERRELLRELRVPREGALRAGLYSN